MTRPPGTSTPKLSGINSMPIGGRGNRLRGFASNPPPSSASFLPSARHSLCRNAQPAVSLVRRTITTDYLPPTSSLDLRPGIWNISFADVVLKKSQNWPSLFVALWRWRMKPKGMMVTVSPLISVIYWPNVTIHTMMHSVCVRPFLLFCAYPAI